MFKLVVLSAFLAIATAKPSGVGLVSAPIVKTALISEPAHIEVKEHGLAKVGDIVESIPTAVSHQSSTIVHSKANIVSPIIAPAVKTYTAPVIKTYSAPVFASAPLYQAELKTFVPEVKTELETFVPEVKKEFKPVVPEVKKEIKTVVPEVTTELKTFIPDIKSFSTPVVRYSEPLIKTTYAEAPIYKSYAAAPYSQVAPLTYTVDNPFVKAPLLHASLNLKAYSVALRTPVLGGYSGPLVW